MTLAAAGQLLGLSTDTLRTQIRRGVLPATKVGRDWLVTQRDLDTYRNRSLGKRGRRPKAQRDQAAV